MTKPRRAANTLWITLGVLFLAAMGVAVLSQSVRQGMRQTVQMRHVAETRWAIHAALSMFTNRLKMRPWAARFYNEPPPTGDYTWSLAYMDRQVSLWARDGVRATRPVTGTTDIFATAYDGPMAMSICQRVQITAAVSTNPRALRVLREVTVLDDMQSQTRRDDLARQLETDEATVIADRPLTEVSARGMDEAAGRDMPPDQALAHVRAQSTEAPAEKTFRETLAKGRAQLDAVDYAGAAATFESAVGQATGSGVHRDQRWMAAQFALARAKYALALVSPEPERTTLGNEAAQRLDQLVTDLGPECAGPSAAYLKAQLAMLNRKAAPRAATATRTGGNGGTRTDVTTELTDTLRRIARGKVLEGGSVPIDELPPQFDDSWKMRLAYTDSFLEKREINFWFFTIPLYWPVSQRLALTDDMGTRVRTLISSGQYEPCAWLAEGQALVVRDHGGDSGYDVLVLDRTGKTLAGFKGVKPFPTAESGGIWVTPAGNGLVMFGEGPDQTRGYWYQELRQSTPAKRIGPELKGEVRLIHDPVQFSQDGHYVAYVDPAGSVKVTTVGGFLTGGSFTLTALTFTPATPYLQEPAFAFVGRGLFASYLVAFSQSDDSGNPDVGRLLVISNNFFAPSKKRIPLPSGFIPGLIVPQRTRESVLLLDKDNKRYLRIKLSDDVATQVAELPGHSFQTRPGRGEDDVIYLAGAVSENEPGIWRWDLSTDAQPELLPLPKEGGPTPLHVITTPVSY